MSIPQSRPTRRRVVLLNRMENRSPGRVAYIVHRSRTRSRTGAASTYRLLADFIRRRQQHLASGYPAGAGSIDSTEEPSTPTDDGVDRSASGVVPDGASEQVDRGDDRSSEDTESRTDENGMSTDETDGPTDEWTKGRLYELAREFDIEGRSKLNKADLLDVVREEWDQRQNRDGRRAQGAAGDDPQA